MVSVARRLCSHRRNYNVPWTIVADVLEAVGVERRTGCKGVPGAILGQPAWSAGHRVVVAAVGLFQGAWCGVRIFDAGHGIHGGKPMDADGQFRYVEWIWIWASKPNNKFARDAVAVFECGSGGEFAKFFVGGGCGAVPVSGGGTGAQNRCPRIWIVRGGLHSSDLVGTLLQDGTGGRSGCGAAKTFLGRLDATFEARRRDSAGGAFLFVCGNGGGHWRVGGRSGKTHARWRARISVDHRSLRVLRIFATGTRLGTAGISKVFHGGDIAEWACVGKRRDCHHRHGAQHTGIAGGNGNGGNWLRATISRTGDVAGADFPEGFGLVGGAVFQRRQFGRRSATATGREHRHEIAFAACGISCAGGCERDDAAFGAATTAFHKVKFQLPAKVLFLEIVSPTKGGVGFQRHTNYTFNLAGSRHRGNRLCCLTRVAAGDQKIHSQ